jgi:hypothetical protein
MLCAAALGNIPPSFWRITCTKFRGYTTSTCCWGLRPEELKGHSKSVTFIIFVIEHDDFGRIVTSCDKLLSSGLLVPLSCMVRFLPRKIQNLQAKGSMWSPDTIMRGLVSSFRSTGTGFRRHPLLITVCVQGCTSHLLPAAETWADVSKVLCILSYGLLTFLLYLLTARNFYTQAAHQNSIYLTCLWQLWIRVAPRSSSSTLTQGP